MSEGFAFLARRLRETRCLFCVETESETDAFAAKGSSSSKSIRRGVAAG